MRATLVGVSVLVVVLAVGSPGVGAETVDVPRMVRAPEKDAPGIAPRLKPEVWGRTYRGDGYVYGPTLWRSSLAVVDIDGDKDNDFVFKPHYTENFVLMRNLGSSDSFYPGGAEELTIANPNDKTFLDVVSDFGDFTGDGRADFIAVANQFSPNQTFVVWYRFDGSKFVYGGNVYRSAQTSLPEISLSLADINGDGLLDVFFMEPYLDGPANRSHRVYQCLNTGTATTPQWAAPVEVRGLSDLMPPPLPAKSGAKGLDAAVSTHEVRSGTSKAGLSVRVSDIEVVDWDVDGVLDFMFYDAGHGIDFVLNTGTATTPAWSSSLNDPPAPIPWRHNNLAAYGIPEGHVNDFDTVFGSFAVRTSPGALLPDAKWLDDFYIAMDGWVVTRRYYTQDNDYRLTHETCIEFATGQGPAAFWDYDGDGDLDLIRTGIGASDFGALLLFPNRGTPYSPVWGSLRVLSGVSIHKGTLDNNYRQDSFTFTDISGSGDTQLCIQRQDGTVDVYDAVQAPAPDEDPSFFLYEEDFGALGREGGTGIEPRGIAVGDFDTEDGSRTQEFIAAYGSSEDGHLVYYDPAFDYFQEISDVLSAPDFLTSYGDTLWPNLIESLAAADLDLDGRTDLIVTVSEQDNYSTCLQLVYRNELLPSGSFTLSYAGYLEAPSNADSKGARMVSFADMDSDGDSDCFVGHQVYKSSNGTRRNYVRFYRNDGETGLDYWRTRVVSGQQWPIYWNGQLPFYDWVLNASGGLIPSQGRYQAGATSPTVDIIQSYGLAKNVRMFIDVLPPVAANESKAVIVVGGDPADILADTFNDLAGFVYWVLRTEGLSRESIRLLTARTGLDPDGDGLTDVTGPPTVQAVRNAITAWPPAPQKLLVYLVDHGQRNRFRLSTTEYLEAADYADWVNTLGAGTQVTTIIDTCEAGSFVDDLALSKDARKAGAERITITSSGIGALEGLALFDRVQGLSFSFSFWQQMFNGSTYGEAFETARTAINAINPLQVPQIDDDGDGAPNEVNDGLLAQYARPGAEFEFAGTGVFIGAITPSQVINVSSAPLWLSGVVSSFPVTEAGALIVPPNFQRPVFGNDDEQPVTGLEWVDFAYNPVSDRWEGVFSGFAEGGLYRVQYYVKSGGRYHASPRVGYVDRVGVPDAWENDDTYAAAGWLPINSVQGHNFHDNGDADWVRFTSPSGESATIAVVAPAFRNQPTLKLYRLADLEANPSAAPLAEFSAAKPGHQIVAERYFATGDQYLLRVANKEPGQFGEGTSYMLIIAVGLGGGGDLVPTTLLVSVLEQGGVTPVANATVRFNNLVDCRTGGDGIAQFVCPSYGLYPVSVQATGYVTKSVNVDVNNLFEQTQVSLAKSGGEGEGEGEGEPGGGCAGGGRDSGGAVLFAALGVLLFAAARVRGSWQRDN